MTFTKEQAEQIKKQLLTQVEQLQTENKEEIKTHIKSLDEAGLEEFLKQNNIQMSDSPEQSTNQATKPDKPIFELIIKGEIPSYKIAENDKSIAILEINPVSKGHCIILPKKKLTAEKIPKSAMTLAQKIAKRIKIKLKPEEIKIETSNFQNYAFINIIPLYKDTKLEKKQASEEELKKLKSKLETKTRIKKTTGKKAIKSIPPKSSNLPKIGFRVP